MTEKLKPCPFLRGRCEGRAEFVHIRRRARMDRAVREVLREDAEVSERIGGHRCVEPTRERRERER